jgi:hypothetical protein
MTPGDEHGGVVAALSTHHQYRPDMVSLACGRVAEARQRAGLSVEAFSAVLGGLLKWPPPPDLVRAWESGVPPPGQVVIACEVIGSRMVETGQGDSSDDVAAAAREAEADQLGIAGEADDPSVESLWQATVEVVRATHRSAAQMFSASHEVRRHALRLADETRRPAALADLSTIAGQATALMASVAFDLDRWDESAALARSAISYAALVGNSSLHAWTLGLAALLANWRNEPGAALDHYRQGLEVTPTGAPRVRLRFIAARSYALLGDASSVGRVLGQARRERDSATGRRDLLAEEIGGEFAFGLARAEACAAAAWLDLGVGSEAKVAARRAVDDLMALPAGDQPVSMVTGARIDLATACLLGHERDQAEDVLREVIATPSALVNVSVSGRLARTRKTLAAAYWSGDPVARELRDALGGLPAGRSFDGPRRAVIPMRRPPGSAARRRG